VISGDITVARLLDEHPDLLEVLASYQDRALHGLVSHYAPQVGKTQVPTLPQLAWPAAEATAYGLLTAAMILLPIAIAVGHVFWIRAAAAVLSLGALAFAGSLGRILWHFARGTARVAAARPAEASAR
jgi:hypothetical protein